MRVAEIMTRELLTIPSVVSVSDALRRARERDVHHLLVVETGRLRAVTCVCELRDRPLTDTLAQTAFRPPEVVWPELTLKQAARRFVEKGVSCFPVCDGASLVGVITRRDQRRSVIGEDELPHSFRCTFCGSTRHVRPVHDQPGLAACLDCNDRRTPMTAELFDEGDKG
jgi:predicted transcriptional regulator